MSSAATTTQLSVTVAGAFRVAAGSEPFHLGLSFRLAALTLHAALPVAFQLTLLYLQRTVDQCLDFLNVVGERYWRDIHEQHHGDGQRRVRSGLRRSVHLWILGPAFGLDDSIGPIVAALLPLDAKITENCRAVSDRLWQAQSHPIVESFIMLYTELRCEGKTLLR